MFRLMGIVFVDWNLVWVWGLKIRGGKSLLMGIADWNFSLLMGTSIIHTRIFKTDICLG